MAASAGDPAAGGATTITTAQTLVAGGWKRRTLPGFAGLVGPLWTRREPSSTYASLVFGLLAGAEHLNPAQRVHGGLLATLSDHALSAIAWEASGRRPCVTVQLDTRYVAAACSGEFLECRGRVVRATGSLVFVDGQVTVDDRIVVTASALLKVLEGPAAPASI